MKFCKPFIRPNLHVCLCERENTKNGEIIGMKKVLLRFPFLASFKLSLLQKKSQGSYSTLRLLFLCLPKMLEEALRLRGDGDKN